MADDEEYESYESYDEDEDEEEEDDGEWKRVKLKVQLQGSDEKRVFPFSRRGNYEDLLKLLDTEYGDVTRIQYKDEDDDYIVIKSDSDIKECMRQFQNSDANNIALRVSTGASSGQSEIRSGNFTSMPVQHSSSPGKLPSVSRWQKGELIGKGANGKVYSGLNVETGQFIAVKQINVKEEGCKKEDLLEMKKEIDLMENLSDPHIVQYLGSHMEGDELYIFLEYVPGGSLSSVVNKFGPLKEKTIRIYTRQILLGCQYLHAQGIIHRDLKGANILVNDSGMIKLSDFGCSKKLGQEGTAADGCTTFTGTPFWMAPEVITNQGYGRKSDVWSLACTIIELATGKPPWHHLTNAFAAMYHIANSDEPPEIPDSLSDECRDFLGLCFQRDPAKRADTTALLKHPFVAVDVA
eukprot:TRINITY_DN3811_c0_g1_i1.p1 TRINITY_DN3811_c0_g1~~TRINITY_DN3811_c0_g1_i1.p1  ORF type:complete len:408 (-),score=127.32 TRINITY_DN3811_c0_g1_i1:179-1402(-)